jgi:hypothetical protein
LAYDLRVGNSDSHQPSARNGQSMSLEVSFIGGPGATLSSLPSGRPDELVEIGLFLTQRQANALIELSRVRRESVGQILRAIIHRELNGNSPVSCSASAN